MGYDATAITIIGVRIDRKKLYGQVSKKSCPHAVPKEAKFCPECGAMNKPVVEQHEIEGYDSSRETVAGLKMITTDFESKDPPRFAIGFEIKTESSGGEGPRFAFATIPNVEVIKADMYKRLKPLGLWDEKTFGVYAILSESY